VDLHPGVRQIDILLSSPPVPASQPTSTPFPTPSQPQLAPSVVNASHASAGNADFAPSVANASALPQATATLRHSSPTPHAPHRRCTQPQPSPAPYMQRRHRAAANGLPPGRMPTAPPTPPATPTLYTSAVMYAAGNETARSIHSPTPRNPRRRCTELPPSPTLRRQRRNRLHRRQRLAHHCRQRRRHRIFRRPRLGSGQAHDGAAPTSAPLFRLHTATRVEQSELCCALLRLGGVLVCDSTRNSCNRPDCHCRQLSRASGRSEV